MKLKTKKPSKVKLMKAGRIVFWLFLGLIFVRGIVTFFVDEQTVAKESNEQPYVISGAAQGFAEAFATDFLTYDPDKDVDHNEKINEYLARSLRSSLPLDLTTVEGKLQVNTAHVVDVKQKDLKHSDMVVKLAITSHAKAPNPTPEAAETPVGPQVITRYLQVPIAYTGEKLYVYDYPSFINVSREFEGESAVLPDRLSIDSDQTIGAMEKNINDFFTAYSEGKSSQLRFYMVNGKEINGYEGMMKFESVELSSLFDMTNDPKAENKSKVKEIGAYTESSWEDSTTKARIVQRHYFLFELQEDGRWLVKEFQGGWN